MTRPSLVLAAAAEAGRRAGLAEFAAGAWHGDVIFDAHGSSRSDVTVIARRVRPRRSR